ncbi:hypothetical protein TWF506_003670 [Arthrobotrys conoides]|uniref:Uncharacterized protein n=1 Tax=Arthrobotrys conoides TaxID=74498 RepID=A0AAN8N7Q3_9PEZI
MQFSKIIATLATMASLSQAAPASTPLEKRQLQTFDCTPSRITASPIYNIINCITLCGPINNAAAQGATEDHARLMGRWNGLGCQQI